MPDLKVVIDNRTVQLYDQQESPVQISYNLEDESNFQNKSAGMSLDITAPATLDNDQTFNTFRNPAVIDLSPDNRYRRARQASILVDKTPILVGKALLQSGSHTNRPEAYKFNIYGDNGDWMVDMQDLTLYDCLPTNTHKFDVYGGTGSPGPPGAPGAAPYGIEDSWFFDGNNAAQTWVYAPVRYGEAFNDSDSNIGTIQMRPALFIYWILQRAFAKYGYRISSQYMDSPVFRRQVMPWTWGNFLGINSKLADLLKFKAAGPKDGTQYFFKTSGTPYGSGYGGNGIIKPFSIGTDNFRLTNTAAPAGFDNFNNYSYNLGTGKWTWTYQETGGHFGAITGHFGVQTDGYVLASWNGFADLFLDVYKNNTLLQTINIYSAHPGATNSVQDGTPGTPRNFTFDVAGLVVGDTVSIVFRYSFFKSYLGQYDIVLNADEHGYANAGSWFQLFRVSIEPGGTVDWKNFEQFKNYKFLDFLRGVLDTADIIPKTDSVNKLVLMEPAHAATVSGNAFGGYFKSQRIDWTGKQDLAQPAEVLSFDDLERDYTFRFSDDSNDGGIKVLANRYKVEVGSSKFRFSSRFKEGTQTFQNRFFSPVVHLRMSQWKDLPASYGVIPQIVAIVPENISNTSADQAEAIFSPKLCYYRGYVTGVGSFIMNGYNYPGYPYMFAVNYQPGGGNDPVLTYNDQRINNMVVPGLMRRFYLQRLAIQDNGVQYQPWMRLNARDITNWMHREKIVIGKSLYLLNNIDRWDPVRPVSSKCTLWKFVPVEQKHSLQVYPSAGSVAGTLNPVPAPDIAYQQAFILTSDLPKYGS